MPAGAFAYDKCAVCLDQLVGTQAMLDDLVEKKIGAKFVTTKCPANICSGYNKSAEGCRHLVCYECRVARVNSVKQAEEQGVKKSSLRVRSPRKT